MPNMCPSVKRKRLKLVHKPSPVAKVLKSKVDIINDLISEIRLKYTILDKEYKQLMELQASLMSKRFKIEGIKQTIDRPGPSTSAATSKPSVTKRVPPKQTEDKEAINKTKLNLKSPFVVSADNEEEEDSD